MHSNLQVIDPADFRRLSSRTEAKITLRVSTPKIMLGINEREESERKGGDESLPELSTSRAEQDD